MHKIKKNEIEILEAREKKDLKSYKEQKLLHTQLSPFDFHRMKILSSLVLSLPNVKTVLDLGSGIGEVAALHQNFNINTLKCDHDLFSLRASKTGKEICADAIQAPFKEDSFDLIVCSELIEHLPKGVHISFIDNLKRMLKPDGFLILTTPNRISIPALEGKIIEIFKKGFKWKAWDESHLYIYTAREISKLLNSQLNSGLISRIGYYFLPGSVTVRLPLKLQKCLSYLNYLVSNSLGRIFPLNLLGFSTLLLLKMRDENKL